MAKLQSVWDFCKKPGFILALIVSSFFLREVFVAAIYPMFSGQDEAAHYVTAQSLAEPKDKIWTITEIPDDGTDIAKVPNLHASEEVKKTVVAAGLADGSKEPFIQGYNGRNEPEIISNDWKKYIEVSPPTIVRGVKLYHQIISWIEKIFSGQNILVRFFLIRIFSVSLGTLVVLLAYFIFKNAGFTEKASLIMTAIVSFQPKFTSYITNTNYDSLLILVFTAFILGSVLFLKKGPDWKNLLLLFGSYVVGLWTKGTAIILIGPLIALTFFHTYQELSGIKIRWKYIALIFILTIASAGLFFFNYNFSTVTINQTMEQQTDAQTTDQTDNQTMDQSGIKGVSLASFLSEASKKIPAVSKTYWGSLKWARNALSEDFVQIIWVFEALAAIGLVFFLILKKRQDFLPEKRHVIFFLGMLLFLLAGILFNDWKITTSGWESLYTTPGRYFLPTLIAHIALIATGIGMIVRKKGFLENILAAFLILMMTFTFYTIFDVIILNFYL